MGGRAERLAAKFEEATNDVISTVEQCADGQWGATCQAEGWSVGITAHHIAGGVTSIMGLVQAMASGQEVPPLSMEQIDQGNAEHAQQFSGCTKEKTLDLLRGGMTEAAGVLRGMTDEQLDRSAVVLVGAPSMTTEQVIENVLIGSATGHLASIQAAL